MVEELKKAIQAQEHYEATGVMPTWAKMAMVNFLRDHGPALVSAGGSHHGPKVETVTMPLADYVRFRAALAHRRPVVADGASMIAAERRRQVEKEGFDARHDAQYAKDSGTLVRAAVAYALYATSSNGARNTSRGMVGKSDNWPWPPYWWKPGYDNTYVSRIRELEKAGALIAATIDLMLAAAPEPTTDAGRG